MNQRGAILEAARRDAATGLVVGVIFFGLCAGVVVLNWKYTYNWLTGPYVLDEALLADPGARQFVRADAPMVSTGLTQQTTLGLLRGLIKFDERTSALYQAMRIGGRPLLIKVRPESATPPVEGRLIALPEEIRSKLETATEGGFHPYLLDAQTPYRQDFNLFILVAGPLFPLSVLVLGVTLWQRADVTRHPALRRLRERGPLTEVIGGVEDEVSRETNAAGPLWITPSWVVALVPRLVILPVDAVAGFGVDSTAEKQGVRHHLRLWTRDSATPESLDVSAAEAKAALLGVSARLSWALVADAADFQRRWDKDRKACIAEADARKAADARRSAPGRSAQ
jgi:hypothetical protein